MNLCLDLLENKNSDAIKKKNTKIIYDYLLKKVFKTVDFQLKNSHVKETFMILDKVYFNYEISKFIKKTISRITFKATSKLSKTAGFCKYRYFLNKYGDIDYGIYEIQISKKIIDSLFSDKKINTLKINGLNCSDRLECYINLYQHEIIHLLISIFCTKDGLGMGGHTRMFKELVYNLFGHTEYKHLLLDGDSLKMEEKVKFNKLNIEIGDIIESKEIKGEIWLGEVIEVNKKTVRIIFLNTKNKGRIFNLYYHYVNKINKKSKKRLLKKINLDPNEIKKKLKIGQIVRVNLKGKITKGEIINIGSKRATIKFDDCKKWYIPFNLIII